jgi:succinate dehydrogenase/fumarate reductase flavoprotein subunit
LNADDVTCDVLVAGSGAAGFATALTAHLEGLGVALEGLYAVGNDAASVMGGGTYPGAGSPSVQQ